MVRWTWITHRGSVTNREPKEQAGTQYDREELRESTTSSRWSEYLVEGRLVVNGLSPSFVSCISGGMTTIVPSTGALYCCIMQGD